MRSPSPVVTYTAARILLFLGVAVVLRLLGMTGILLLGVAVLVSGLLSFVLLSRQRDAMSAAVVARSERVRRRMAESTEVEDIADDERRAALGDGPPDPGPPDPGAPDPAAPQP